MPDPKYFVDSKAYQISSYQSIFDILKNYPDICRIDRDTFTFKIVGVICLQGEQLIVFPKAYVEALGKGPSVDDARLLVRVLMRYRNEGVHTSFEKEFLFNGHGMSSNHIAAAMFLIEDYCQNGFIKHNTIIISQQTKGKTDWQSTINKTIPIFSDESVLYCFPITKNQTPDSNDIVTVSHKYVVRKCFDEWGWCFGYNAPPKDIIKLPFQVPEVIRQLEARLQMTYIEREILVIRNIIEILSDQSGINNTSIIDLMATPYYSFVWEAICSFVMDNRYSQLKSILPQPEWDSHLVQGSISQRPDIFWVYENILFILDAKYYDYSQTLPGWHDIVKQLFYRHTMQQVSSTYEYQKHLPGGKMIFNAFLFPSNSGCDEVIGRVYVPRITDLGEIKAFSINQKQAMKNYVFRDDTSYSKKLRQFILNTFLAK